MGIRYETPAARLHALSIPEPNTGCWLWLGPVSGECDHREYGRLIVGSRKGARKNIRAHRYAYEVFTGIEIPAGMEVCHSCDNTYCINPDHLWVGTKQQNIADRESKGRNKLAFGEANGQAKLSATDVDFIRQSKESGASIARRLGVSRWTVNRVRAGKQWPTTTTKGISRG